MRPHVLLCALFATFALSACFGRATYHWKEEVLLHDGRVIVIERSVRTGEVPVEIGQPPGESDYTLTFTGPDGRRITWDGGRDRFVPMILDFANGNAYVVANGATGLVYGQEGCPRPPYFFFRWSGSRWERLSYDAFPRSIRRTNLSAGLTYPSRDSMRERIARGELVNRDDVQRLLRTANPEFKEIREDAPNPCATRADDFRYAPKERVR